MAPAADPETEGLFQLPLDRFTEARNELAAKLRGLGKAEAAAAVKALPKPPASAWAVNQVYWKSRPAFDALLRAGARLAEAQRRGAGGEELRDAIRERREAMQAALRHAEEALASAGHGTSPQVLRRVSSSLEALASGLEGGRAGVLTEDLQAPGFEALAGLAPVAPRATGTPAPEGRDEERERAAVEAARLARRAEEAEASLAEARERLQGARSELQEAQRRLDRARERVEQSERAVQEAEAHAAEARSNVRS